jgi:hypothetical protein
VEAERVALWDVSFPETVEHLERSLPTRVAAVARVFERSPARRLAKSGRAARALNLLAKREVAVLLAVTRHRCVYARRNVAGLRGGACGQLIARRASFLESSRLRSDAAA